MIIVADKSWGETLPDWLIQEINAERMIHGMVGLLQKEVEIEKVGDSEIVAYLATASLYAPIDARWVNIYIFLSMKLMLRIGRITDVPEFAKEIYERGLNDYEKRTLEKLKGNIARTHERIKDVHPVVKLLTEIKKQFVK